MKTTTFTFFKNTPLIDFQNTIHFGNNAEREAFFLSGGHYTKLATESKNFNWVRDRSTVDVSIPYNDFRGVNYCTFLSDFEPGVRYYAYVMEYKYINDANTRVFLLIDPIMTFMQGVVLSTLKNLSISRQHLTFYNYESRLPQLKTNGDILKTSSKKYFYKRQLTFDSFMVVFQCACDLTADFGTVDDPKIETSKGVVYDGIISPVNLYVVAFNEFNNLMGSLAKYPWITQNIKSVLMIPTDFIDQNDLYNCGTIDGGFTTLKAFVGNGISTQPDLSPHINMDMIELYALFGLDNLQEKHLLRNEYTTIECYAWDGQQLIIDTGLLHKDKGLNFKAMQVVGYKNQVAIYLDGYKTSDANIQGSFLNDAIIFSNFDEIPILVDNFNLSLANTANQRKLTESKLLTNRVSNILDPKADLKTRFMDAASLVSGFSLSNLFGKFSDEYEFYRTQKAEQADLALNTPTITSQSNGNAFQVANGLFGLSVKFSKPDSLEMYKIKKYYQSFGYECNEENAYLSHPHSMSIANYFQFKGSWSLPNVDVALIEMMKAQFENGVRFWHNDNTSNPMIKDLIDNEILF